MNFFLPYLCLYLFFTSSLLLIYLSVLFFSSLLIPSIFISNPFLSLFPFYLYSLFISISFLSLFPFYLYSLFISIPFLSLFPFHLYSLFISIPFLSLFPFHIYSLFISIPFLSLFPFYLYSLFIFLPFPFLPFTFEITFFQIIILHCHTTLFLLCSQGGGVRMPKVKKTLDDYFKSSKIELGQHLNGKKRIQKEGKVERDWRQ